MKIILKGIDMDSRLDLAKVFEEIYDARNKSYNVGLCLGLKDDVLDSIHKNPRNNDDGDCLREVIREYLKRVDPDPTWRAIADALKCPTVDEPRLAKQIEAKYCTHRDQPLTNAAPAKEFPLVTQMQQVRIRQDETPTSQSTPDHSAAQYSEVALPVCTSKPPSSIGKPASVEEARAKIKMFEKRFNTLKKSTEEILKNVG